ncbi:MAG: DUF4124 domain-containing protein [Usitatibacter sp.]
MHTKPTSTFIPALAAAMLFAASPAGAQLFKCQGPDGKVVFSDVRCEGPAAAAKVEKAETGGRHQLSDADKVRIRELEEAQKRPGATAEWVSGSALEISSIRSGQEARLTAEQRARRDGLQAGLSGTDAKKRKDALNAIREIYSQQ